MAFFNKAKNSFSASIGDGKIKLDEKIDNMCQSATKKITPQTSPMQKIAFVFNFFFILKFIQNKNLLRGARRQLHLVRTLKKAQKSLAKIFAFCLRLKKLCHNMAKRAK